MRLTPQQIVRDLWIVFAVYWLAGSLTVNKMRKREPALQQLSYVLIVLVGLFLLFGAGARFGFLNRTFVEPQSWVGALAVSLTALGIGFAIWARHHIGRYWSGSVSLREGHQLIRTGPYSHIRHPIYAGILVAVAGTLLLGRRYIDLAAFAVVVLGLTVKAKREEALLAGEFGAAFEEHRRHTGFFLPRFSA